MLSKRLRRDDGFTLVELLVVCLIIGILAAIAIPMLLGMRHKAEDGKARSDLRNVAVVEEAYATNGTAYATATQLVASNSQPAVSKQDSIYVYTKASDGYCLVGHSSGSDKYLVYDSLGGGLQQTTYASLSAADQVCTDAGYVDSGSLIDDGTGLVAS